MKDEWLGKQVGGQLGSPGAPFANLSFVDSDNQSNILGGENLTHLLPNGLTISVWARHLICTYVFCRMRGLMKMVSLCTSLCAIILRPLWRTLMEPYPGRIK